MTGLPWLQSKFSATIPGWIIGGQMLQWLFGSLIATILFVLFHSRLQRKRSRAKDQTANPIEGLSKTGLCVLREGSDPTVDIVAVHGIAADPDWTWVSGKVNWLKDSDMLPAAVPNARILRFGYGSQWLGKNTVRQRLSSVARDLLERLDSERESCQERPVVFIGHCFGGLVIEKAILLSDDLKTYTSGVIFLSTPHRGSKSQPKAFMLATIAAMAGLGDRSSLLKAVEDDSDISKDIVQEFVGVANKFNISYHCFFELIPTDITAVIRPRFLRFLRYRETMVDEDSGCLDGPGRHGLMSDHFRLNKFVDPEDRNFELVRGQIKKFVDDAPGRISLVGDPHLARLFPANEAAFDSQLWQNERLCLSETRVELLHKITEWSMDPCGECIYWLKGMAGTGKSTIARTVAKMFTDSKPSRLGASYFFARGHGDLGHANKFFVTLAYQLARIPGAKRYIIAATADDNYHILGQGFRDQWKKLILDPLNYLPGSPTSPQTLILVIDALDECESEDDVRLILKLLAQVNVLRTVRLRVFLTSRPELPNIPNAREENLRPDPKSNDIIIFLNHELQHIRDRYNLEHPEKPPLSADWPDKNTVKLLAEKADGLFIYAATTCRFIQRHLGPYLEACLSSILDNCKDKNSPISHLDQLYGEVLNSSFHKIGHVMERDFKQTLASIVALFDPLPTVALANLLDLSEEKVTTVLEPLFAVLDVPQSQTSPVRLLHPSFRDFLLDMERHHDPSLFWVDEKKAHSALTDCCMQLMSGQLKRDLCDLRAPSMLTNEVDVSKVKRYLPRGFQYACQYWVQHLQKSEDILPDGGRVHKFLLKHALHWLEALSLIGKISEGVHAIQLLEDIVDANGSPQLYAFVHDAKRFVLYNKSIIEEAPLQIYYSALLFAPEGSLIRENFRFDIPHWIYRPSKVQNDWGPLLQTLDSQSSTKSVLFSTDGSKLASSLADSTVRVWRMAAGQVEQTLKTPSSSGIVFSPNLSKLASVSDTRILVWNIATKRVEHTLEGHSNSVTILAFSPDGTKLASGSYDGTVHVWNVATGKVEQRLEGHLGEVGSVVFSPDGSSLVSHSFTTSSIFSAGNNTTILVWNITTGEVEQTLKVRLEYRNSVVVSSSGSKLALRLDDNTLSVWNTATGQFEQTLKGNSSWYGLTVFSPDGSKLVSDSSIGAILVWNINTGQVEWTLKGHSNWVRCVAFSPDGTKLASGSFDKVVRVWNIVTGQVMQTLRGHLDSVSSILFSPDGSKLVSGSDDGALRVWKVVAERVEWTVDHHLSSARSVVLSNDGSKLASLPKVNNTPVLLWNVATGQVEQTLEGHLGYISEVAFSSDGSKLATGSSDKTVRVWNTATGQVEQTLNGHLDTVISLAFSPDGSKLASGSFDKAVRLWNVATGQVEQTLEGHLGNISEVVFSPDGNKLATGLSDGTVWVWNVATGQVEQKLKRHRSWISSVLFSPDGSKLVSGSADRSVHVWNVATGQVEQTPKGRTPNPNNYVRSMMFSRDGSKLALGSKDGTVWVWNVATREVEQTLESYSGSVSSLVFLPRRNASHSFYSVDRSGRWVTRDGTRVLYLHLDHRPGYVSIEGSTLAIVAAAGEVTILIGR